MKFEEAVKLRKTGVIIILKDFEGKKTLTPESVAYLEIRNRFVVVECGRLQWNITAEMSLSDEWEIVDEDKYWTLFSQVETNPWLGSCNRVSDVKKCKDLQMNDVGITGSEKNGFIVPESINGQKVLKAIRRFGDLK